MTNDELKLIGLKALVQSHWKFIENCQRAANEITGEPDENGHTCDWLFDASDIRTAAELIDRVRPVSPPPTQEKDDG